MTVKNLVEDISTDKLENYKEYMMVNYKNANFLIYLCLVCLSHIFYRLMDFVKEFTTLNIW